MSAIEAFGVNNTADPRGNALGLTDYVKEPAGGRRDRVAPCATIFPSGD